MREIRSAIPDPTRTIILPFEIVHLDIPEKVEEYLRGYVYTAALLDDFTAKSNIKFAENKS